MKINTYVCEGCGKKTEDLYDIGWLQIEGKIVRGQGRNSEGQAHTDYIASNGVLGDPHTFCSITCLATKLNDIKDRRDNSCGRGRCSCVA